MKSIRVNYRSDAHVFEFDNRRGETVDIAAAPGRPRAGFLAGSTLAGSTLADPTLADPTLADPTLADPTLADPTLADPTLAHPNLAGSTIAADVSAGGGTGVGTFVGAVGSMLGSGTLIGYLSRAVHETGLRVVILTVLTDSGEQVAGPLLSEQLDDDEAGVILRAAAETEDPINTLRRFVTFRPDRGALASR